MSEEAKTKTIIGKKTKRAKEAKGWFLTYPQTGKVTPDELLVALKEKEKIVEYVIAREEHKDGNLHLHAFVKLESKRQFKSDRFDVCIDNTVLHGNYQIAKSWKAVEAYVKKGKQYIASIDVESAKQKRGKNNLVLATMDPVEAVKQGEIAFMDLQKLVKNQGIWKDLTMERSHSEEEVVPKDRHVWLHGPSNSGKTTRLRQMLRDLGEENCYQMPTNNDWTGYRNQRYLWMDEFKGQLAIQELNRICDGDAKVNTKGGTAKIRRNPTVILVSNFDIRDCYRNTDGEILKTIYNRFKEEYLNNIY